MRVAGNATGSPMRADSGTGKSFMKGLQNPKVVEAALEKLNRVRSWKKKEKIWRKLFRAQAAIKNFDNIFNSRKSKIIYMEK